MIIRVFTETVMDIEFEGDITSYKELIGNQGKILKATGTIFNEKGKCISGGIIDMMEEFDV